jgi:hypothetical protein
MLIDLGAAGFLAMEQDTKSHPQRSPKRGKLFDSNESMQTELKNCFLTSYIYKWQVET